jgi:hypothetical protein
MQNEDMLRLMKALALPVEAVALEIIRFQPSSLPGLGRKEVGVTAPRVYQMLKAGDVLDRRRLLAGIVAAGQKSGKTGEHIELMARLIVSDVDSLGHPALGHVLDLVERGAVPGN